MAVKFETIYVLERRDFEEKFPNNQMSKKRGQTVWLKGCLMQKYLDLFFMVNFYGLYQGHITILQHHLGGYVCFFFLSIDQTFRNTSKLSLEELKGPV